MRIHILLFIAVLVVFSSSIVFSNGLNLNSIGPKSLGMGGAYIGLANDYSAIFWNPAGLTQLKSPQLGLFFTNVLPTCTYEVPAYGVDAKTKSNIYPSPGLIGYLPIFGGNKITASIGAYVQAGLGAEWDGNDLLAFAGPPSFDGGANPFAGKSFEWMSSVGAFNISPAVSYKLNEKVSFGAALNIFYGIMEMKQPVDALDVATDPAAPAPGADGFLDNQYEESGSGVGFGMSFGVLVKPVELLSFGFSIKSRNKVAFEGEAKNTAFQALGAYESDYERDLTWPLWLGAGVAITPAEKLVVTADVQFSQWSATQEKLVTEYTNEVWAANMPEEARTIHLNWEDKIQLRFGAQYQMTERLTVRGGYYYDPAPGPDETANILLPSFGYNGFTFGGTYQIGKIGIDCGFEYLAGSERDIEPSTLGNMPGIYGMNIITFSLGASYLFQ